MVEQRTENPRVGGSNPPLGTSIFRNKIKLLLIVRVLSNFPFATCDKTQQNTSNINDCRPVSAARRNTDVTKTAPGAYLGRPGRRACNRLLSAASFRQRRSITSRKYDLEQSTSSKRSRARRTRIETLARDACPNRSSTLQAPPRGLVSLALIPYFATAVYGKAPDVYHRCGHTPNCL